MRIFAVSCTLNIMVSAALIPSFGVLGAIVGTAAQLLVGHMTIYLYILTILHTRVDVFPRANA